MSVSTPEPVHAPSGALGALADAGVSIWLDDLGRELIRSGDLAGLVRDDHVTGVTTNPTIFDGAVSSGAAGYAEQLAELAAAGADAERAVRVLTTDDVRDACDVLRPVWEASGGVDGRVSIEVDPRLARDTEATVAQARELWQTVDRPNVLIKIPATVEGLPAVTRVLAEGICVNVTLIFSVDRYRAVMDAWLAGLEAARAAGRDLTAIHSVASFFVSRVDTLVDGRLDAIGTPEAAQLRGEAGVANARRAWGAFLEVTDGPRWASLRDAGAAPQRPLWASTGVKDPAFPDTKYVADLVVRGCVNTMPGKTMRAFADHGVVRGDTISGTQAAAQGVWDGLSALGIDEVQVFDQLEEEGLVKFVDSWTQLLGTVGDRLSAGTDA
jgi:transaldolase